MTTEYRIVNYEEAKAADSRGEYPAMRRKGNDCWFPLRDTNFPENYEFRIAIDPYADLKAAQAQGKVIQIRIVSGGWADISNPNWTLGVDNYRVKPEPVIEVGKFYRDPAQPCNKLRALCNDAPGPCSNIFVDEAGHVFKFDNHCASKLTEWADAYDNWRHDIWRHVPSWARWLFQQIDGAWCFSGRKPTVEDFGFNIDGIEGLGILPEVLNPTNFTGTWEQSLQERPE